MDARQSHEALDRREFILAAGSVLALLSAGGCARLEANPPAIEEGSYVFSFAAYPTLAQPGGLAIAGPARLGRYKGNLYIKRLDADSALVLGARCRHLGCDVDWDPEVNLFVCPCHNSQYSPDGQLKKGPARHALFGWRARVEADRIVLAQDAPLIQS